MTTAVRLPVTLCWARWMTAECQVEYPKDSDRNEIASIPVVSSHQELSSSVSIGTINLSVCVMHLRIC